MYVGIRYSVRAKKIFSELHEQAFIVELDLRGTSYPILFSLSTQLSICLKEFSLLCVLPFCFVVCVLVHCIFLLCFKVILFSLWCRRWV